MLAFAQAASAFITLPSVILPTTTYLIHEHFVLPAPDLGEALWNIAL
jgi:hypothetical protein